MAYGIESRFPLADSIQLQEVAFSLAASDLIDHGWSKLALRRMAQGVLPDEVVWNQAKSAYGSPQHHWVKNNYPQWLSELHPQMSDILDVAKLKILASKMISSGKSDGLFRVKALSEWMKQFVS
jgi:asparagine synthetase B (glutamine-hydrolysing)